jgi:hypothetical protein
MIVATANNTTTICCMVIQLQLISYWVGKMDSVVWGEDVIFTFSGK